LGIAVEEAEHNGGGVGEYRGGAIEGGRRMLLSLWRFLLPGELGLTFSGADRLTRNNAVAPAGDDRITGGDRPPH
jgi:hypothetical protein